MAAFGFEAPEAQAGTYSLNASAAAFCLLGHYIANVPGFGTSCDDITGQTLVVAPRGESAGGDRELFEIDSPSGALTITDANPLDGDTAFKDGYGGGTYWNGGGRTYFADSGPISSQYWGFQIVCNDTNYCAATEPDTVPADAYASGVDLTVTENSGPSLSAGGLWSQAGKWVWNPPGDPWPLSLTSSDPSGVCGMAYNLAGVPVDSPAQAQNAAVWQQCPDWTWSPTVDTTSFEPTSGELPFSVEAANAAGVSSSASEVLDVDNIQPSVSITPQDDSNPGGWAVNHSVTLRVAPRAGPSGISSVSCSDTLAGTTSQLTLSPDSTVGGDYDVTVDGNGSHQVACSVANNAIDPQGAHDAGTASETVDIDEQPPTMSFEATNPSDPDQVIVDLSDNESPLAGGTIEITPQGSSTPMALPTTFNPPGQLVASIPDASLKAGAYTLQASATSEVGNTGTVTESVTLPLRTASMSIVSFKKIVDPRLARKVKERVRVGFHYVTVKKHGKKVRVKKGGHYRTITVIKRVERCTTKKVKVAKHRYRFRRTCKAPRIVYDRRATVGHGKKVKIYGELTTSQNVALADQTVEILETPKNGNGKTRQIGTATTNATGGWSATVSAGPSRTIRGYYPGADTVLPTSGSALEFVPARVKLAISPTELPWGAVTRLSGKLVGGFVPAKGVAMRILIKIPGLAKPYVSSSFRTTAKGTFSLRYIAPTIAHYPETLKLAVDMVGAEDAYPFTPNRSEWVNVRFGVKTPHVAKTRRQKTKRKRK